MIFTLFSCKEDAKKYNNLYQRGKQEANIKLLQKGYEKAEPYFSKLCLVELCNLLPKQKSVELAEKALKKYPDSQDVLELLVSLLYEQREYLEVISEIDENSHIKQNNELKRYYFSAKIKTSKSQQISWESDFCVDMKKWFQDNQFSLSHNQFFKDFSEDIDLGISEKARQLYFTKNYSKAAALIEDKYSTKEEFLDFLEELTYVELTEIADNFVLGANNRKTFSSFFANGGLLLSNPDKAFYSIFSAGRILEKEVGSNYDVLKYYNRAIYLAPERNFDRALWYFLRCSMNYSLQEGFYGFLEYANAWKEPEYFDDILDRFSASILSSYSWELYYDLFSEIYPYLSGYSQGKVDYIFARLVEENLIEYGNGSESLAFSHYEKAFLNPETDGYYRIMAGIKLEEDLKLSPEKNHFDDENLLPEEEYLQYLLEDNIESVYNFCINNQDSIRESVAFEAIKTLENASKSSKNFYPEALRIATAYVSDMSKVDYLYPKYYSSEVKKVCKEYDIPEYIFYGLIRTESYFDNDIESVAGAIGLCQLMPSTASDVGRKLKVKDYDLLNPETNAKFGGYYLAELASRLEDNYILALCSYNAGINNVRKWRKANPNLPIDIFLETIPFEETRNYGKKLIKASSIYGLLYYDASPKEVVSVMGVF